MSSLQAARPFIRASFLSSTAPTFRSFSTTRLCRAGADVKANPLVEKLRAGLKDAMRSRDTLTGNVIKSALAEIQTTSHLSNPPAPLKTLQKLRQKIFDSIESFSSATPPRTDMVKQLEQEVAALDRFLPQPGEGGMDPNELEGAVRGIMEELGLKEGDGKAMGRLVKAVREKVAERAEGKQISDMVKKVLGL